jgi:HAD superfamily hydrolase (TIGR01509 family)
LKVVEAKNYKNQKIKAVFFDLDGVLIDAKEWHHESLNIALSKYFCKIEDSERHIFEALPTLSKLKMLQSQGRIKPEWIDDIVNIKNEKTFSIAEKNIHPSSSILNVFSFLNSKQIKTAICSNSISRFIHLAAFKLKILDYVDLIVSNQHVFCPKPNPEMYIKACNWFSLQPEECFVVEDSPKGIQAATEAGCNILIVSESSDVCLDNLNIAIGGKID